MPLTLSDVAREAPDSPQHALLLAWLLGQWGGAPTIAQALYSRAAQQDPGTAVIASTYAARRKDMWGYFTPRIVATRRTPEGAVVLVKLFSRSAPPLLATFRMVRERGSWRMTTDGYAGITPSG